MTIIVFIQHYADRSVGLIKSPYNKFDLDNISTIKNI